jgi:hypothetical protein
MKNKSKKIESIQAELTELEKMYHTITDMAAEHFDDTEISTELQLQVIKLTTKLRVAKEEQKQYEAECALEDSQEFDKYSKD